MTKPINFLSLLMCLILAIVSCNRDDDGVTTTQGTEQPGLRLLADGFASPILVKEAPDGSGRKFVLDQTGKIFILDPDDNLVSQPFLDISSRMVSLDASYDERGLLGLAFHPDFENNNRFFVYYSAPLQAGAPADFDHTSHISEFTVSADSNLADVNSEQVIMQVDQPQGNHNGGMIEFGPDGFLYISLGDGGAANDVGTGHVEDWYDFNEGGNAQNVKANLLGKIVRIDVNSGSPYGIPGSNPFAGSEGQDEIYAYGFRNPYRFSFDQATGTMLVADAGQNLWEEVSVVTVGNNYGWNVKEGTHCFDAANPDTPPADCPDTDSIGNPFIDPVIEFPNSNQPGGIGLVVVGGYVYRGTAVPDLTGQYIFGSWSTSFSTPQGKILSAPVQLGSPGLWTFTGLNLQNHSGGDIDEFVMGFGQDLAGEVYVLTKTEPGPTGNTGKVYKISML